MDIFDLLAYNKSNEGDDISFEQRGKFKDGHKS
jgi:hypothetical protein